MGDQEQSVTKYVVEQSSPADPDWYMVVKLSKDGREVMCNTRSAEHAFLIAHALHVAGNLNEFELKLRMAIGRPTDA